MYGSRAVIAGDAGLKTIQDGERSLCRIEAGQPTQACLSFQSEIPSSGPIAAKNFVQLALHATGNYDLGTHFYASLSKKREACGAGGGEALDRRAQHVLSGGGERQAGKGSGLLLNAG